MSDRCVLKSNGKNGIAVTGIKNMEGIKYFSESQIKLIRRSVKQKAEIDIQKGKIAGVKEWMVIDLLSSSGLRVSEAADLRCGDLRIRYGESEVFVRNGKGSKSRYVQIPDSLKKHLKEYLNWKKSRGEPTDYDDHLFIGQRGHWTSQAIQKIVKKYLKALNLYENGKSVHALRHSYAVALYRREKDIRAVQKQLGHASIQTTLIYADILKEDIQDQLKGLWG